MNMKRYLTIFGILIICFTTIPDANAVADGPPKIEAVNPNVDLGYVPFDFNIVHYYTIKNTGKGSLHIDKLISNCDCTFAIAQKTDIKPGDSTDIKVTFGTEQYYGVNTRHVAVYSNDPKDSVIYLNYTSNIGTYPKHYSINPKSLFFLPGHKSKNLSLNNASGKDTGFEILIPKDSLITVDNNTGIIDPHIPYELKVFAREGIPKGTYETNITIIYDTALKEKVTVPIKIVR